MRIASQSTHHPLNVALCSLTAAAELDESRSQNCVQAQASQMAMLAHSTVAMGLLRTNFRKSRILEMIDRS